MFWYTQLIVVWLRFNFTDRFITWLCNFLYQTITSFSIHNDFLADLAKFFLSCSLSNYRALSYSSAMAIIRLRLISDSSCDPKTPVPFYPGLYTVVVCWLPSQDKHSSKLLSLLCLYQQLIPIPTLI